MHYVRFLKQPTLRITATPKQRGGGGGAPHTAPASVYALVTLETDLGDSIYYGTAVLTCSVLCDAPTSAVTGASKARTNTHGDSKGGSANRQASRVVGTAEVTWSSGLRSLAVEVPVPRAAVKDPTAALRLRVAAKSVGVDDGAGLVGHCVESGMLKGHLVMPVVIPQTSAVAIREGATIGGKRQVERPLPLGNGNELVGWEDSGVSMARHVWDAGVALVALLSHTIHGRYHGLPRVSDLLSAAVRGRQLRVLELGAGCGTGGTAFAALVPNAKVLITDVPEAERLVACNIRANSRAKDSSAEFQVLDWAEELPEQVSELRFDIVLVADCIYNEDSIPALVSTLSSLAQMSPEMVVLVATKRRHSSESIFFDLADEARLKICAKTHVLAPAGYALEDLDDAERIDMYELMFAPT